MKLPRDLSGSRLADHLIQRWGYIKVHQVGSHIILQTTEPAHTGSRVLRTMSFELER
jgi:predicted RNA binding protein YcfA (HicA-like mRNA interferase family)